jgi:NADPH2:quinone reductase
LYPNPAPYINGREGAGVVTKVGAGVKDLVVGDRVAFLGVGSYAEQAAVNADRCIKLKANVSFAQGAAATLQGLTAHYLTRSSHCLKPGDVCLVHAGAGGTGSLVIQMAKVRVRVSKRILLYLLD